jgi:hypothetical protein
MFLPKGILAYFVYYVKRNLSKEKAAVRQKIIAPPPKSVNRMNIICPFVEIYLFCIDSK